MLLVGSGKSKILIVIVVILSACNYCFSIDLQVTESKLQILKFDGQCRRSPDTAMVFELKNWKVEGKHLVFNSTMNITHDLDDVTLRINFQKCRSKENPDSCQNVYSLTNKNPCRMFEVRSSLWTPVLETVSPPWKCPIKEGFYTQTNAMFDITPVLFAPLEKWYWKSDVSFTDKQGRLVLCMDIYAKVTKQN